MEDNPTNRIPQHSLETIRILAEREGLNMVMLCNMQLSTLAWKDVLSGKERGVGCVNFAPS